MNGFFQIFFSLKLNTLKTNRFSRLSTSRLERSLAPMSVESFVLKDLR